MSEKTEEKLKDRPELDEKLSEMDILKQSLDEAKKKQKDYYDQIVRQTAEFDNYRKRTEAKMTDVRRQGKEEVLLQVVNLCDMLVQAEQSLNTTEDLKGLKKGMTLVFQQFGKFLKDQGLQVIKTDGEKLNPHHHEAIAQEVNDKLEEGTIIAELQRGYLLGDQVIRHARVRVSTKSQEEKKHV